MFCSFSVDILMLKIMIVRNATQNNVVDRFPNDSEEFSASIFRVKFFLLYTATCSEYLFTFSMKT
jgi:hypothetical protein